MMIYDISQPVFSCEVYPGDPKPERQTVCSMERGDSYNLTAFSMCAHNGTHLDAPRHFYQDGKGIDAMPLEKCIGFSYVHTHDGNITAEDAAEILHRAEMLHPEAAKRILIRGRATVIRDAAAVFASAGIHLIGNESQTVGPENAPMEVHLILLKADVVLLEGIRLGTVPDGVYLLNCAPLNLSDADGAPCRAVLIKPEHLI